MQAHRSRKGPVSCHGQRGFTLIEMLIALVVVALLAAITVPRVRDYAATSRQVNLRQTASDIANGLDADYLRLKGYPTSAGAYATEHAELPRIKVAGVEWGVFNTTADRSGTIVQVRSLANTADSCTVGVGTLANGDATCTSP